MLYKNLSIVDRYFERALKLTDIDNKMSEHELVQTTIVSFINDIAKEITTENLLYSCIAIPVGSSFEGTRPYLPDEFDFLLLCHELQKYLKIYTDQFYPSKICIDSKPDLQTDFDQVFDVKEHKFYMDILLNILLRIVS